MRKKILLLFLVLLCVAAVVIGIGFMRRFAENRETVTETTEATAGTDVSAAEPDDEQEYYEQLQKDQEKVEQEGNIFKQDSYQIYGGFGYSVKKFKIFDSYADFVNSEYCNPDYVNYEPQQGVEEGKDTFVYAEVTVTNEDRYEKTFVIGNCKFICAEDEKTDSEDYMFCPSDHCYTSKVENWKELPDKSRDKFDLKVGESVTIEIGDSITYRNKDDLSYCSVEEALAHPSYYLSIYGSMPMNGEGINLRKNLSHIYIELEETE